MNRLILTIAATIACLTSAGETLHSQEKPNNKSHQDFHRQIFVPLENLDVLLDGNSNRVLSVSYTHLTLPTIYSV